MINNLEMALEHAQERRRNQLAYAEHARLVAACGRSLSLARRMARPLGRGLFHLGARLLRYANADRSALPVYHPSARSVELN